MTQMWPGWMRVVDTSLCVDSRGVLGSSEGGKTSPVKLHGVNFWVACGAILCAVISPMVVHAGTQKGEREVTVSSGTRVSIEYTLRLEDKAVIDTNVGSDPLTYVHGSDQMIPGLQKGLEGMKIGESKQVTVKPEEGYGAADPEAFTEVGKEKIPQSALRVGAQLKGRDASGRPVYARVVEVRDCAGLQPSAGWQDPLLRDQGTGHPKGAGQVMP